MGFITRATALYLCLFGGLATAGTFTITNLGNPAYDTEAFAVNAFGDVALTPCLPGVESIAYGINSMGVIAGTTFSQAGAQAVLFYDGQTWAVANFDGESYAKDVNDAGQVAGSSGGRAYIAHNGQVEFLTHTVDAIYDTANAINEEGAVAGTMLDPWGNHRAYLWFNGQTMWTGFLGGRHSFGTNLNDVGQSTGYAQTGEGWMHAFLSQGGLTIDLGTLGGTCSYAYGINNAGHVVGYSFRADGTMGAFLSIDGVMIDLSSLVEGLDGWTLSTAYGINDAGQIVGTGFYNGRRSAFRLDPVVEGLAFASMAQPIESIDNPEPGTAALVLSGLLGVCLSRKVRGTGKTH